ncbi:MAG: choice-of-anchor tandem repeat GloVer-containing protein [Candidatus Korobacteraceae bacterium]|jgi:uncharacterized repeat protein (TIGR03803 family)
MKKQSNSLGKFRFNVNSCVSRFAMAFAFVSALTLLTTHAMQAQTFSVLHNFSGGGDGAYPYAGVIVGPSGVLYGTAFEGGTHGYGTVFRLSLVESGWILSPLYEFTGGSDGGFPYGGLVIGPNGALYGTTTDGGTDYSGIVFQLRPSPAVCKAILCYWNETVLHTFTGNPDGYEPFSENLIFDQAGNIYGTTSGGGMYLYGTAFELTPSGTGYTESILHSFGSGTDGENPDSGVVLDTAGNVYETTFYGGTEEGGCGGYGCGTVYQLIPSNGGWLENVLVNFNGANGDNPSGNLIIDASGNLYGITSNYQSNGYGVVFKLTPSGGQFTYSALYTFNSPCESYGGVAIDAVGHFFGVCVDGGAHQDGWIFELTNCSQTCTLVDLHDFSGSDGASPYGGPVLDANGNLYGTTYYGGTGTNCTDGCGVVWEIAGVGAQH